MVSVARANFSKDGLIFQFSTFSLPSSSPSLQVKWISHFFSFPQSPLYFSSCESRIQIANEKFSRLKLRFELQKFLKLIIFFAPQKWNQISHKQTVLPLHSALLHHFVWKCRWEIVKCGITRNLEIESNSFENFQSIPRESKSCFDVYCFSLER